MKISKINHLHAGIKKKTISTYGDTGYLYNPVSKDGPVNMNNYKLKEHIKNRVNKANELYKIFNPFDSKFIEKFSLPETDNAGNPIIFDEKDYLWDLLRSIGEDISSNYQNLLISSYLKIKKEPGDKNIDFIKSYEWILKKNIKVYSSDNCKDLNSYIKTKGISVEFLINQMVSVMTTFYLRKTLSLSVSGTEGQIINYRMITEKLLYALLTEDENSRKKLLEAIDKESMLRYLRALYKDYFKKKQIESIELSIRNQNVPVQCRNINKKKYLMLSNGSFDGLTDNSGSKKSYVFSFIKEYAGLDDKEKKVELLSELNRLLVLFIYGKNSYDACKNKKLFEFRTIISDFGVRYPKTVSC